VATATLVEAITGAALDPVAKALLCQKAEHDYVGVPCGIMDQFASVMCRPDHLMLLDCRSQQIEHVPFSDPNVTVLIINTNVKHELSGGEYGERRAQCESAAGKLGLVSLRDATLNQLESLRDDYEVSCPELDLLVQLAHDRGPRHGVIGARMTGGGFGGCTVNLIETAQVDKIAKHLVASYQAATGIEPSVLTSRPARGAH